MYTATIGGFDTVLKKVLLANIHKDGKLWRSHSYVCDTRRLRQLSQGDVITFSAKEYDYIGLDADQNQTKKTGLSKLREINKLT